MPQGTQHTDMSYSYLQEGGDPEVSALRLSRVPLFRDRDPGDKLSSDDVAALARHTALPDVPRPTSLVRPGRGHRLPTRAPQGGLHRPGAVHRHAHPGEGAWLLDGFNESDRHGHVRRAELDPQVAPRVRRVQARYWPNGAVNKIYPTGLGPSTSTSSPRSAPSGCGSTGCTPGHRSVAAVYPVLVSVSGYVLRAVVARQRAGRQPAGHQRLLLFPVVTRFNVLGVNVFRGRPTWRRAGRPAAEVALRAGAGTTHRGGQPPPHPAATGSTSTGWPRRTGVAASQAANACAVAYGVVPPRRGGGGAVRRRPRAWHPAPYGRRSPPGAGHGRAGTPTSPPVDRPRHRRLGPHPRPGRTFTWEVWNP